MIIIAWLNTRDINSDAKIGTGDQSNAVIKFRSFPSETALVALSGSNKYENAQTQNKTSRQLMYGVDSRYAV